MLGERTKLGSKGTGDYYRIEVKDSSLFKEFRNHDVGSPGGLIRVAGVRRDDSWDTQGWLIEKDRAHIKMNRLVPDSEDSKELINTLGGTPTRTKGDIFHISK